MTRISPASAMARPSSSSMDPISTATFPNFPDGDVAVAFTAIRVYRLHSSVLKRNSMHFAEKLHGPGAKLNKQAREDGAAGYRLEFRRNKESENLPGSWIRKDVNDRGRFETSANLLPELSNGKVMDPEHRCWEWLFGTFYNKQPDFDDETLATLLSGCMGLIDVAESVGSADHVRKIVDLALLQQDEGLWSSISINPGAWAELACRCHSQAIFKESVCHIVGKWLMISEEDKADLSEDIRVLCAKKFKELDIAKEAIEMRILGHYPNFLYRDAGDKPGRPSYASDIYMWMALDFFRQWFAQNISNGNNRKAADGGYDFYKKLSLGGTAYLDHIDFRNFHQYFPMSSKACGVLERDMGVLKEDVKPFVQDLMKSQTHLDSARASQVEWLTCAVVTNGDCPWVQRDRAEREEAAALQKDRNEQMFIEEETLPIRSSGGNAPNSGRPRDGSSSPIIPEDTPSMELTGAATYYGADAEAAL